MSDSNNFIPQFSNVTFFSLMEKYKDLPDALQNITNIQIDNLRSINEVNKASFDDLQKVASRQQEVFANIMKSSTALANDIAGQADPAAALKASADNIQKSYESAIASANEVSEIIKKSSAEAQSILKNSAKLSLDEIKSIQQKVSDAS